jgi:hypothetical protein
MNEMSTVERRSEQMSTPDAVQSTKPDVKVPPTGRTVHLDAPEGMT